MVSDRSALRSPFHLLRRLPSPRRAPGHARPRHPLPHPRGAMRGRRDAFVVIRHAGLETARRTDFVGAAAAGGVWSFLEARPAAGGAGVHGLLWGDDAARLTLEIAGAAGLEKSLRRSVAIVGGKRAGLRIEDALHTRFVQLRGQPLGLGAFAKLPRQACVIVRILRREIRAVPGEVIRQRSEAALRLARRRRFRRGQFCGPGRGARFRHGRSARRGVRGRGGT